MPTLTIFETLVLLWITFNTLILVLLYYKYRNIQGELEVSGYDSFFDEYDIDDYKIQGVTKDDYSR